MSNGSLSNYLMLHFAYLRQEDSALFTASIDMEETYDAFERDIALVSFYFKNPTVFEYLR